MICLKRNQEKLLGVLSSCTQCQSSHAPITTRCLYNSAPNCVIKSKNKQIFNHWRGKENTLNTSTSKIHVSSMVNWSEQQIRSWLPAFLQSPLTSPVISPYVILCHFFANPLKLHSSLTAGNKVLRSYKFARKDIIIIIIIIIIISWRLSTVLCT